MPGERFPQATHLHQGFGTGSGLGEEEAGEERVVRGGAEEWGGGGRGGEGEGRGAGEGRGGERGEGRGRGGEGRGAGEGGEGGAEEGPRCAGSAFPRR